MFLHRRFHHSEDNYLPRDECASHDFQEHEVSTKPTRCTLPVWPGDKKAFPTHTRWKSQRASRGFLRMTQPFRCVCLGVEVATWILPAGV